MDKIATFINALKKKRHTESVFNPYRQKHLAANLDAYLRLINVNGFSGFLLVGEAPGYAGCKLTGIPFSSGSILLQSDHAFLQQLRPDITIKKIGSEATATIVWQYLSEQSFVPLFWNAFPFHPHPAGKPEQNRAPTAPEIEEGAVYLQQIIEIFNPSCIAGLGRTGEKCLKKTLPGQSIDYIRHPSRGGKSQFVQGMNKLIAHSR